MSFTLASVAAATRLRNAAMRQPSELCAAMSSTRNRMPGKAETPIAIQDRTAHMSRQVGVDQMKWPNMAANSRRI
eukprot:scaffold6491_cov39-Isochrysis_galbana.AAC.1